MGYKDVLVYLDPTPASEIRLAAAVELAKAHGARLIGVDASTDAAFAGQWAAAATQIENGFEQALRNAGISGEFLIGGERRVAPISDHSYCVDLIIAPSSSPDTRDLIDPAVPDHTLMNAGEPVLILPPDWRLGPLGRRIVIAWSGSREAKRAVHDALPLLKRAEKVVVFAFSAKPSDLRISAERLAEHLARHRVTAQVSDWTNTGDTTAIEALFASLDTQDADLIVAGAFGHTRLFENWFGGTSLDLLKQPSLPILMSH